MKIRHASQWLLAVATLSLLLACSPDAPVAGRDPGWPMVAAQDPNVPAWSNAATTGAAVDQGSYGPAQAFPRAATQMDMPNVGHGGATQSQPEYGDAMPANPAAGQDMQDVQGMSNMQDPRNPSRAGVNAGQWQGADPSQVQAMTPEQQEAFYSRAESERSRIHDEIVDQIRRSEDQ